jgi:hypothetical protein
MKSRFSLKMKLAAAAALLAVAGLLCLAATPAEQPLTKDDVTLLLLGSTPPAKMVQLVEQRGVDFQVDADAVKKFRDQGANDEVINALKEAANKPAPAKVSAPAPAATANPPAVSEPSPGGKPNAPDAPEPVAAPAPTPAPAPAASASQSSSEPVLHSKQSEDSSDEPILHTRQARTSTSSAPASSSSPQPASPQPSSPSAQSSSEPTLHTVAKQEPPSTPATASGNGLKDPSDPEIQHIIQQFAAKEKIFKEARNNYTYHQINKVEELSNDDTQVTGSWQEEWDITYDDKGNRIERVTYAPGGSLKKLILTKEDYEGFRNIQPFVLTTDELPEYDIKYLGHVKVDEITAYVFRIQPKELEKGKQYFKGQVYVDDRDLQIVMSEGRQVPEGKKVHGQENLFPEFKTWREQIDGKFWFPTYTMGKDVLYFENGPVHMKEIVRYTDYKQFKSREQILNVQETTTDKPNTPAPSPPKN